MNVSKKCGGESTRHIVYSFLLVTIKLISQFISFNYKITRPLQDITHLKLIRKNVISFII